MNLKSWGVGVAILAGVVMSFAGSAWYFARPGVDSAANETPAVVSAAKDPVKADGVYAAPFVAARQNNEVANVNGRWVGDVDIGSGMVRFTFNLKEIDGRLTGSAAFPIGEVDIQDGKVDGNQLSFTTQHPLPSIDRKLVTRYVGTVADNGIELFMTMSEGAKANFTIKRIAY